MAFVVRIHAKSPTGPKRGEFGPFPTQSVARRQAQVIADELVAPGHVVTVERVRGKSRTKKAKSQAKTRVTRKITTTKRRNPHTAYGGKPRTILVNGKSVKVTNALSSGPGEPPHTYELAGGAYVYDVAGTWTLVRPYPIGPVGKVTVEVPR